MDITNQLNFINSLSEDEKLLFAWKPHKSSLLLINFFCISILISMLLGFIFTIVLSFLLVFFMVNARDGRAILIGPALVMIPISVLTIRAYIYCINKMRSRNYGNDYYVITDKKLYISKNVISDIFEILQQNIPLSEIKEVRSLNLLENLKLPLFIKTRIKEYFPVNTLVVMYGTWSYQILTFALETDFENIFNFFKENNKVKLHNKIKNNKVLWKGRANIIVFLIDCLIKKIKIKDFLLAIGFLAFSWIIYFYTYMPIFVLVIIFYASKIFFNLCCIYNSENINTINYTITDDAIYISSYFDFSETNIKKISLSDIKNIKIQKETMLSHIFNVRTIIIKHRRTSNFKRNNSYKETKLICVPNWKKFISILDEYKNNQNQTINKEI